MSIQSVKFFATPSAAQPRGTVWAPDLMARLTRTGRAVWREVEAIGQARANRELQRMAQLHAHNPELAQALLNATRPASQRG